MEKRKESVTHSPTTNIYRPFSKTHEAPSRDALERGDNHKIAIYLLYIFTKWITTSREKILQVGLAPRAGPQNVSKITSRENPG